MTHSSSKCRKNGYTVAAALVLVVVTTMMLPLCQGFGVGLSHTLKVGYVHKKYCRLCRDRTRQFMASSPLDRPDQSVGVMDRSLAGFSHFSNWMNDTDSYGHRTALFMSSSYETLDSMFDYSAAPGYEESLTGNNDDAATNDHTGDKTLESTTVSLMMQLLQRREFASLAAADIWGDLTPLAFRVPPDTLSKSFPTFPPSAAAASRQKVHDSSLKAAVGALDLSTPTTADEWSLPAPIAQPSVLLPIYQLAFAGAVTTLCSDMVMHPIDCIKTLQQSDMAINMNVGQAAQHLYQTAGGIAGFYRGFWTYAITDATGGAMKFSVWESWKRWTADWTVLPLLASQLGKGDGVVSQQQEQDANNKWAQLSLLLTGAVLAFLASSFILVPGELVKNALQLSQYESFTDALTSIYQASGVSGFYTGYSGVLYRDIPSTMLELGLYEAFKGYFLERQENEQIKQPSSLDFGSTDIGGFMPVEAGVGAAPASSAWRDVAAAALTGGITAVLTTPLDTIKTKIMIHDALCLDGSFADCMSQTVEMHGLAAIFAGVVARVAWIMPSTAMYLPLYDCLKRSLLERHQGQQSQQLR